MLRWIEGFEEFASAAGESPVGLRSKYGVANDSGLTLESGRTQGLGIRIWHVSGNPTIQTPSFGNLGTWIIGFGFRPGSAFLNSRIFEILDGSTVQFALWSTSDGKLEARRGTTSLAISDSAPLVLDEWVFLEVKVTIGAAGSYEIRSNATPVLSDGSADTQASGNAYGQTVKFWGIAGTTIGRAPTFDDLYIADTSGGDVTDFLGMHRAITLYPNGDGDLVEWTPSTGSDNSAMVDDVPKDDDSTYIASSTPGQQDLYGVNVDGVLVQVAGVQINAVCRETDVTPFSIKLVTKSGSTTDEGSSVAIGAPSYVTRSRVLERDPDTDGVWSASIIAAAQFGIELDA